MRIYSYGMDVEGDHIAIAENATQDPSTLDWTCDDTGRDALLVEILDSASNEGYIVIKHSNATSGTITWTELLRLNHDRTVILNSVLAVPDAPGSDQIKLFLDYFLDRLQPKVKTSSELLNLVLSDNVGRIWYSKTDSFPSGAKRGDLLIKPAAEDYVEKEVLVPLDSLGKGSAAPSAVTLGNYSGYSYGIGDDSKFEFEIPHDWVGGAIELYAHLYCNENYATNNGYVNWEIKYSCTPEDGGEALDAPTHSGTLTSNPFQIPATAKHLMEAGPVTIPAADLSAHDVVGVTFKRIANTGGQNNPTAEPVIVGVELEYRARKINI